MNVSAIQKLTRHYDQYFGQTDSAVLHPVEGEIHIDCVLYKPSKAYPFWKLATIGCSDYALNGNNSLGNRNEYMLFIDPAVDMNDGEAAGKYYDLLVATARYAIEENTFISYGHSIQFAEGDSLGAAGVFIELPQAINDSGILRCKLSLFKKAICLQVIPLDKQALELLLKVGNEEFAYTYAYPEEGEREHWLCKLP